MQTPDTVAAPQISGCHLAEFKRSTLIRFIKNCWPALFSEPAHLHQRGRFLRQLFFAVVAGRLLRRVRPIQRDGTARLALRLGPGLPEYLITDCEQSAGTINPE